MPANTQPPGWSMTVSPQTVSLTIPNPPSLSLNIHFPGEPGLASFIEAKDDGSNDGNWSYKSCKAPVKSSPPTNQHTVLYRPDALPVAKSTVSKH